MCKKLIILFIYFISSLFANRIPVIIDTDIGTDIDDTWALSYLLLQPEVDIKLVLTESHNTPARTKVAAKFLQLIGRTDIPIGTGFQQDNFSGPADGALFSWANDFNLNDYNGTIYEDGISAMLNIIESLDYVILLVISPCPNIQIALEMNQNFSNKVKIIAMGGSLHIGYNGMAPAVPEYNIVNDIPASWALYNASWTIISAPLDVTVFSQIGGLAYQQILNSQNPITQLLIQNYQYWYTHCSWANNSGLIPPNPENISSTLHDLVSAFMIVENEFLIKNNLPIMIESTGDTVITTLGRTVTEATSWKSPQAIKNWGEYIASVL